MSARNKVSVQENVTIEVAGNGADARRIVRVGDWSLTAFDGRGDDEPRMSIAEIARRVGQSARKLRQTARGVRSERFRPVEVYSPSTGRVQAFTELYLSEAEALYLCTKLRTAQAETITWEMIRVYMLARRGLLPQQRAANDLAPLADALVKLTGMIERVEAKHEARFAALEARLDAQDRPRGLAGARRARAILDAVAAVADCYAARKTREWNAKRRETDIKVRDAAGAGSRAWADLDAAAEGRAWQRLVELRALGVADEAARKRGAEQLKQMTLFDALPPGIKAMAS